MSLVHTCKGMDGEGLMGLNNVHLKLKVNGAAASQRNSMANTKRQVEKEMRFFYYYDLTSMGEWKHGWLYGRIQRDRQALGRWEVKKQSIEDPNTHSEHWHTHTFVQVVRLIG